MLNFSNFSAFLGPTPSNTVTEASKAAVSPSGKGRRLRLGGLGFGFSGGVFCFWPGGSLVSLCFGSGLTFAF